MERPIYYTLSKQKKVIPTESLELAFSPKNRVIGQVTVGSKLISTVFLGIDHNFSEKGPPIVFETMIFEFTDSKKVNWSGTGYCRRYSTYWKAKLNHYIVVLKVILTLLQSKLLQNKRHEKKS